MQSQQLINFRRATDSISQHLRQTANALSLPRIYDNPVLLRFQAGNQALTPTDVNIFYSDILVKQLPLDTATDTHRIDGKNGHIEVAIENRSARIISASCKHKTCMKMGAIGRPGQHLVCIPNQITVAIAGTDRLGVDSLTY